MAAQAGRDRLVTLSGMCGIVGYVGHRQALDVVVDGLRRLEYRGYDSAGVAILTETGLAVERKAGRLANLENRLAEVGKAALAGTAGMGHTRWATHGPPVDRNAHPHRDTTGRVAVVHNGIIENFAALRTELEADGVEQRFLAAEVDVEAGLREPHPLGEFAGGEGLVAVGEEHRFGRLQDLAAPLMALATRLAAPQRNDLG